VSSALVRAPTLSSTFPLLPMNTADFAIIGGHRDARDEQKFRIRKL
jgi:hypothetical protein